MEKKGCNLYFKPITATILLSHEFYWRRRPQSRSAQTRDYAAYWRTMDLPPASGDLYWSLLWTDSSSFKFSFAVLPPSTPTKAASPDTNHSNWDYFKVSTLVNSLLHSKSLVMLHFLFCACSLFKSARTEYSPDFGSKSQTWFQVMRQTKHRINVSFCTEWCQYHVQGLMYSCDVNRINGD